MLTRRRVREEGGKVKEAIVWLLAAWAMNIAAVWVAKVWLHGERQGYILFSIGVSYLYTVLVLCEWLVPGFTQL